MKNVNLWLIVLTLLGTTATVHTQTIAPAPDGTGTIVTPNGNQFNIGGGTQSGANLYQSFQQFGLNQNQIANFLSNPDVQNILGRVVGGDPSIINGLVQVTGSNANLYLMNPAGIIFGANASLNVPASFTATTANGIRIDNQWFNATGTNNYLTLHGNPNGFAFTQSGSIFNAGTLSVNPGQSLTLLGGTVVNTGTIAAPGGSVTIAAIPGEQLVRLTPQGSLLSVDLPLDTKAQLNANSGLSPLDLPALLTGSNLVGATGVTVDNGIVQLTSSGVAIPTDAGVAIVSGNISAASSLPHSIPPQITILGNKVGLLGANVDASGTSGGTILIGGDYQGKGTVPNALRTYVSRDSTISANGLLNGDGGRVIVWADDTTAFYGNISARGGASSGNGGFVEVSGKRNLTFDGIVNTQAPNGIVGTLLLDPDNITITDQSAGVQAQDALLPNILAAAAPANMFVSETALEGTVAAITLQANDTITINNLTTDGVLNFAAPGASIAFQANQGGAPGGDFVMLNPANTIQTNGRTLSIAAQNITTGIIDTKNPVAGNGGSVVLSATGGNITTSNIDTRATIAGNGGNVTLNVVGGTAFLGNISTTAPGVGGTILLVGSVELTSNAVFSTNGTILGGGVNLGTATVNANTIGAQSLTINGGSGTIELNNLGVTKRLAALTVTGSGTVALNGTVVTNGAIDFGGFSTGITLTNDATFDSSAFGGTITFGGTVINGATLGGQSLTLNAGVGNINMAPTIGPGTRLNNFTIVNVGDALLKAISANQITQTAGTGTTTLGGALNTTGAAGINLTGTNFTFDALATATTTGGGAMTLNNSGALITNPGANFNVSGGFAQTGTGSVTLGANIAATGISFTSNVTVPSNITLDASVGTQDITFNGTLNAAGTIAFNAGANDVVFGNTVNSTAALNGLTFTSAGSVSIAANVTAASDLTFPAPVVLTGVGGKIITAPQIQFNSTLAANAFDLTLVTNDLDFAGGANSATGTGNLSIHPSAAAGGITLGSPGATADLDLGGTDIAGLADGFSLITIGRPDGTGKITVAGPSAFKDNLLIQSPLGIGDFVLNDALSTGVGTTAGTITVQVADSITGNGGSITTQGQAIVLNADRDASGAGHIVLNGVTVNSNGSDITLGGGLNPLTTPAVGTFSVPSGVRLNNTSLNAGTGNISIRGQGLNTAFPANPGVDLRNNSLVEAGGTGTIKIEGEGQGTGTSNLGLSIASGSDVRTTGSGDLTLTGIGNGTGSNQDGISIGNAGTLVETTGTGNLILTGSSFSTSSDLDGVAIFDNARVRSQTGSITIDGITTGAGAADRSVIITTGGVVESLAGGAIAIIGNATGAATGIVVDGGSINPTGAGGNVTLTADEINVTGASVIGGSGNLLLQPLTPTLGITVGGAVNDAQLNLDSSELSLLQNGFSGITIGRADSSGAVMIAPATFQDPTTIRTTNAITVNGAIQGLDNASITLNSGTGITLNTGITTNNNAINLNAPVTLGADLTLNSGTGTLTFGNTVNGAQNLILTTGAIQTNGAIGGTTPLTSLNVTSGGATSPTAIRITTTNNLLTQNLTSNAGIFLRSLTSSITTGNLTTTGVSGGEVSAIAATTITAGIINTSGTTGNGGNVTLDPPGLVQVTSINAQGGTAGIGGIVNVNNPAPPTSGFFRATGSFVDQNGTTASISTSGGAGSGAITIRHGGNGITPFIVGDAGVNGTAAAITSSAGNTIAPTQSFFPSYFQGNISIITDTTIIPSPIIPPPSVTPPGVTITPANAPFSFFIPELRPYNDVQDEIAVAERSETELWFDVTEEDFTREYTTYLKLSTPPRISTLTSARRKLQEIYEKTRIKSALIYVRFVNRTNGLQASPLQVDDRQFQPRRDDDQLEMLIVTSDGEPILKKFPQITRVQVLAVAQDLRTEVTNRDSSQYLTSAQQLHRWLISTIDKEPILEKVENLVFVLDAKLRSMPIAALHDGQKFVVEKYGVSIIPSFSLTDVRYNDIREAAVLAMGASQFSDQEPLPGVPLEIANISKSKWRGRSFINQSFTLANLKLQRDQQPFQIIHLATHGEFRSGDFSNSYLQLWDQKLLMEQIRQLGWSRPGVDLLVLSACRTALGDEQAELGFAGFAIQSGVRSTLASLWYVSDEGTLGLMTEFYQRLKAVPVKVEALRQSQVAMIQKQVRLENGQLITTTDTIPLPRELRSPRVTDFSHPYYWSSFTLVGNPW